MIRLTAYNGAPTYFDPWAVDVVAVDVVISRCNPVFGDAYQTCLWVSGKAHVVRESVGTVIDLIEVAKKTEDRS